MNVTTHGKCKLISGISHTLMSSMISRHLQLAHITSRLEPWFAISEILTNRKFSSCSDPCPPQKYMDVKCKVALVTGGNSGIGLAIADSLLQCGLRKAVIAGVNCQQGFEAAACLNKRHGEGRAEYQMLDVTNHKQFEDVFKESIHREGNVDILVNNAGILKDKHWEQTIDINVKGVLQGIILANKYMPKQKNKGGVVVNVASILGFDTFAYAPVYTSSKHAVIGLTKCFGHPNHYSKTGVRQVACCPGVTITELVEDSSPHQLEPEWGQKTLEALMALPSQKVDAVGRGTVYMIEYGPPGSLWVVEGSTLQRVLPPDRKTYQQKIMDL